MILQVTGAHRVGVLEEEWAYLVEDIVNTEIGRESQLSFIEGCNRAVSSTTSA